MANQTIGIFAVMLGLMGAGLWVLPRCYPKIPRKAVAQGFAPAITFMIAGAIGHDSGLVKATAYTSLWAVGLATMFIVPQITVMLALRKQSKS